MPETSTARRYGAVFDTVAAEYDRHRPTYPDQLIDLVCQAGGLTTGDRVLEIGCGTGRNVPFLRAAVGATGKVYGVDLSSGMLRRARALCR